MKTTEDILLEYKILPRKIIFDVINKMIDDSKWKIPPDELTSKIMTWHQELIHYDDDRILSGLRAHRNSKFDSIPTIGVFKQGCDRKKTVTEDKPTPDFKKNAANWKAMRESIQGQK